MSQIEERPYKDPLREFHPSSAVMRAGYRGGLSQRAVKPPVFRTTLFDFGSAEEAELWFQRYYELEASDGNPYESLIYSRLNNPNIEIFEDKMVALEGGSKYASLFPSGMGAITTAILALVPKGGHVLFTNPLYGGSYFYLTEVCPGRLDLTSTAVDASSLEAFRESVVNAPRLDALFLESPANPTLMLADIAEVAKIAKERNPDCLVFVDNTFMGPVFQSPLQHGADVVLYSATKYICGHSDTIAGIVLTVNEEHTKKVNFYRNILGFAVAPDSAWLLTRSLETVWMRMERHAQKAQKLAKALAEHRNVDRVVLPGCIDIDERSKAIYAKQCHGTGGMVSMIVKPNTRKAAFTVLNNLQLPHLAVSLGSTETLVSHPRSMTNSDMPAHELEASGILEGMIRISVGLESSTDLINDFVAALDKVDTEASH